MEKEIVKKNSFWNVELTDKQKKGIDIFVNGSFVVLGLSLVLGYLDFEETNFLEGIFIIYVSIRYFPRNA